MSRVKTPEASGEPESQSNGVRHAARLGTEAPEAYDALAELFLGEADVTRDEPGENPHRPADDGAEPVAATHEAEHMHRSTETEATAAGRRIDLVIAGHLPIMASAWVRQYAATRAPSDDRPAALVRLLRGRSAVELLGGGCERLQAPMADRFEDALRVASASAGAWVVRVDEPFELDAAACEGLDTLTVLTGADDAAMVAAYRLLKGLRDTVAARQEAGASLRVRIAVMGCDGAKAEAASSKLRRAAASCLGLELDDAGGSARVTPARGVVLFDREGESTPPEDVVRMLGALPEARPSGGPVRREAPTIKPVKIESDHAESDAASTARSPSTGAGRSVDASGVAEAARSSHGWTDPVFDLTYEPTDPAAFTPGLRTDPQPRRAEAEPARPKIAATPDDAGEPAALPVHGGTDAPPLWRLHGQLQPLHAGCPMAPGVELARDGHGRLHLLTWDGVPDGGMAGLTAAASWARSHAAWLGEPGGGATGEPVLHMFTRDAVSARSLVWSDVRVHAVTPVETGEGVRWVRTPLN